MQYLVQRTTAAADPISWYELESGGYQAEVSGVRLEVSEWHTRAGNHLRLMLRWGSIAELIHSLADPAARQYAGRAKQARERGNELRQEVFEQLVFGAADPSRS